MGERGAHGGGELLSRLCLEWVRAVVWEVPVGDVVQQRRVGEEARGEDAGGSVAAVHRVLQPVVTAAMCEQPRNVVVNPRH